MKEKIKTILNKTANVLSNIYGYGIMLALFIGGLSFFGYLAALIIGGDIAAEICAFIYKGIYPYLVYVTSIFVLLGLLIMYLRGESALSSGKKKKVDASTANENALNTQDVSKKEN